MGRAHHFVLEIVRAVAVVDKQRAADYELCSYTKVRFRSEFESLNRPFSKFSLG